jgi:hypothetical protein
MTRASRYIAFSFIKEGVPTKAGYCGKPIMIHPEKKTAWGLVVKGPSTLTYHSGRDDKSRLELDAGVEFKLMERPVPQKIQLAHCYCVIIQRDKANNATDGPLLTMHEYKKPKKTGAKYGTKIGNSKYTRQIRFPGDSWILFTEDKPTIGNGAYLWIESQSKPTSSHWYNTEEMKRMCLAATTTVTKEKSR